MQMATEEAEQSSTGEILDILGKVWIFFTYYFTPSTILFYSFSSVPLECFSCDYFKFCGTFFKKLLLKLHIFLSFIDIFIFSKLFISSPCPQIKTKQELGLARL